MSGLPSPEKSPPASSAVNDCQPEPICARPAKPPCPSPRYISSAPSLVRASTSGWPSPLQSPGASSAVNGPQPVPICSARPVTKPPAAVAAVHQQPPVAVAGEDVGLPSPSQSRGQHQRRERPQPLPICSRLAGREAAAAVAAVHQQPAVGGAGEDVGLPSPLQSPVSSAVNWPQPVPIPSPPPAGRRRRPSRGRAAAGRRGARRARRRRRRRSSRPRGRGEREGGEGRGERGAEHGRAR